MRILTRYLLGEMVVPFLIGQAAIVLMLTGSVLYNNANLFVQFQVPVSFVVRLALFFVPFLVNMTMPVAMAVAASLAVSRLARDSEITVMRAAGISVRRIFLPIFVTGLLVSIGDFYFGEYAVPWSITRYMTVLEELPTHLQALTPAEHQYIVSEDQQYVIGVGAMTPRRGYIELNDIQIMSGIRMTSGTEEFMAWASTGRYTNGEWTLYHPFQIYYDPDHPGNASIAPAGKLTYRIAVDPAAFQNGFMLQMPMGQMASSATRTFHQIGMDLKSERERHITDYTGVLDYHFKLSVPFSCLVMAICCPPIALRWGRGGGFMGTLLSICLVFVYWNTLLLARILGSPGPGGSPPILPPPLAAWSQNVLFVLLGLWVLRRSE